MFSGSAFLTCSAVTLVFKVSVSISCQTSQVYPYLEAMLVTLENDEVEALSCLQAILFEIVAKTKPTLVISYVNALSG